MNDPPRDFEIGRLAPHHHPLTGKWIDKDSCGICSAKLRLPGEYPLMVVEHHPEAKLYDLSGEPGSTNYHGKPRVIQHGLTILKPVCWHHTN